MEVGLFWFCRLVFDVFGAALVHWLKPWNIKLATKVWFSLWPTRVVSGAVGARICSRLMLLQLTPLPRVLCFNGHFQKQNIWWLLAYISYRPLALCVTKLTSLKHWKELETAGLIFFDPPAMMERISRYLLLVLFCIFEKFKLLGHLESLEWVACEARRSVHLFLRCLEIPINTKLSFMCARKWHLTCCCVWIN